MYPVSYSIKLYWALLYSGIECNVVTQCDNMEDIRRQISEMDIEEEEDSGTMDFN